MQKINKLEKLKDMKFNFDKLRLLRLQHGKTQTELAQILNVSQSTYGGYEKGTVAVSIDKLILLCSIYKIAISSFFEDEERGGGSDGRPTGQKTGQISPETTGTVQEEAPTERTSPEIPGTVQEEARTGQKNGQTSPDAPLCTVSITINVNTDSDKRKVGQILQLLQ